MSKKSNVLHVKLTTDELIHKVDELRDEGYNVPALVRNFLTSFHLSKKESNC